MCPPTKKPSSAPAHSKAAAAAAPGAVRIPDISDFEVERLGDLAGVAVHAPGADYELAMVDVASDSLLGVPPPWSGRWRNCSAMKPKGRATSWRMSAANWAAEEDMPFGAGRGRSYVRRLAGLAAGIDPATKSGLYVWTS